LGVLLLGVARAGDVVTLTNGSSFACTVVRYEGQMLFFKGEGGLTNAVALAVVRNVVFGAAQPPVAVPAKPVAEVRIVTPAEVDKSQRARGYLLLMMPVTKYTGLLWVTLEKPQYKVTMIGARKQSGVRWSKVFDTAFERTGQMMFELPPGKFRVNLYAINSGRRRVTPAEDHPPGRLVCSPEVEIIGGNVTTYSIKYMPPPDTTTTTP
jgi:hypothetical protein